MSDLFHEEVPLDFIRQVFDVMAATPQHTYQVLTKRSKRLARDAGKLDWPANVWMGVSVESQRYAFRIDHLREVPAAVRFVSAEPLLGSGQLRPGRHRLGDRGRRVGPEARPMDQAWVEQIRDDCLARGVAFFFKQWGGRTPKASGRELDGRTWDEMPQPLALGELTRRAQRSPWLRARSSSVSAAREAVLKHGLLVRYAYYFAGRAGAAARGRVAFVDGYAGEGRYDDGSPGSPLLLASQAERATLLGRDIKLAFVEPDGPAG